MRFIPTRLHAVMDYVVGLVITALPFMLGIEGNASKALVTLGLGTIGYSLFTDYELGLKRFLRVRFHLALDAIFGIVMLLLPTVFAIPSGANWPVYIIGILALTLVFTTEVRATGTAK